MMNLLITIAAFVFALGVLIVVHEFGHYLVARAFDVKVLRFSVGFGRVLASRRVGPDRTEWAIAAFPLGGYVKMLDEREGEVATSELPRAFNRQPVWRRFLIVLAGPLANFLLAMVLYWAMFMHGVPGMKPIIGAIAPASMAAQAGLRAGDVIIRIQGQSVGDEQEARWLLLKYAVEHQPVKLEVQDAHGTIDWHQLDLSGVTADQLDGSFLHALGIESLRPPLPAVIDQVLPNSAAQRSGLQVGDRILTVGGSTIENWDDLVRIVGAHAEQRLDFEIERAGSRMELTVTPGKTTENGATVGRIGVLPYVDRAELQKYLVKTSYAPLPAATHAIGRVGDISLFILRTLGKMLVGEISFKNLSGPITIADYAGQSAQVGWIPYLMFIALISISLGVLNLLPIPLLDGGHLMYYIFEIFKGSPVSEKAMAIGQNIGMVLLFMLMAFALYNDITHLISRS